MPLPQLTLTGTLKDASGQHLVGTLFFQPNAQLSYVTDPTVVPQEATSVVLNGQGTFSVTLLPCDAVGVTPAGWSYVVTQVTGYPNGRTQAITYQIQPTGSGTVNLANLTTNPVQTPSSAMYVPLNGGTMTGPLVLSADPMAALGAATKEYVDAKAAGDVTSFNGRTGAVVPTTGDYTAAQVGADASGAAATAQANAQTFATSAVATETTRATTAEGTLTTAVSQRRIQAPAPVLNRGRATVIATYAAGHGWTANGFASSNVNDTSGGRLSGQMLTGTTTGNVGNFPTFTKTGAAAVNLTGQALRVWIMVDVPTNVNALTLRVAGTGGIAGNNYLSWTALASSGGTYRTNGVLIPPNTWTELSFSLGSAFTVGAPTPTAITEYRWICQDNGTAFTCHFGGIEAFPATTSRFPNGVVCIGFDDCYAGQYSLAMNLLSSFGYPATVFPIIDQIGGGGSWTLAQLQQMVNIGWEVAPHAYTLADHSNWNTLTQSQVAADVNSSLAWIVGQGFGLSGAFAYPLGGFNGGISATVAPLCTIARTIDSTMYTESSPVGNVLQVRSAAGVGGVGGIGIATYTTASTGVFALAKAAGAIVFITIHDVSSGTSGNINQISIADLTTLVTSINSTGLACTTFGEVIKYAALGTS